MCLGDCPYKEYWDPTLSELVSMHAWGLSLRLPWSLSLPRWGSMEPHEIATLSLSMCLDPAIAPQEEDPGNYSILTSYVCYSTAAVSILEPFHRTAHSYGGLTGGMWLPSPAGADIIYPVGQLLLTWSCLLVNLELIWQTTSVII